MTATTKSTYVPTPGKGALFAMADRDTGEIASITGRFTTPEGLDIRLDGQLGDDGILTLVGSVDGIKGADITGYLSDDDSVEGDHTYKRGTLTVSGKKLTKEYKLNSKVMTSKNGEPYRFIWISNNRMRVAF